MTTIVLGLREDLEECCRALEGSKLFDEYFKDDKKRSSFILEGIEKQEVHIAKNENNKTIGFMRIDDVGMFSGFPFLRLIAVNNDYRCKGFGTQMLEIYESKYKGRVNKIFLCVSSFNDRAKKLYAAVGFKEVGRVEGLYKKGTYESIMMKEI